MNYAIIAAGEGSRLAKEGFTLPKPMVSLHGEMLIDRLIRIFLNNNPESIHIIINENSPELEQHLRKTNFSFPITIVRKSTPSSLHSFYEILQSASELNNLCLTTTDTVFKESEFKTYISEFESNKDIEGLMAVTTFIDDESPLFVHVDSAFNITGFTDQNHENTSFISGGIYCLRGESLKVAAVSVESGINRMRNFQRNLIDNNLKIKAHRFSKIVDVDHVVDIETAELFLLEENEIQILST